MVKGAGKKILITAALPYANGPLHLGHMVEYVQADVFARFLRMTGAEVAFVCADDAHGAPIEIAAAKAGQTPEELIARYRKEHMADFEDFLISFDVYHTTHSTENKDYSDFFYNTLKENGFIYERTVEQTYCNQDGRFLPDRFVKGKCPKCKAEDQYGDNCEKCNSVYKPIDLIEPHCAICRATPSRKVSTHYFFKLSNFSKRLKEWIEGNGNVQQEVKNFALNWIKKGLEDWDITRDKPYFGFKIPGEESKYYYVWLDAPIGYVAATQKLQKSRRKDASDFWQSESTIIHFIGKDIIYFHLLFWPAMLMGIKYNLPSDVVVHGHLTINDEKMSKSRGNFYTAREYLDKYDPELLRFYYAANLGKNLSDINLDFKDFQRRINDEFVANVANFTYRTLNFINRNFDSKLGKVSGTDEDVVLKTRLDSLFNDAISHYRAYNYREAIKVLLEISSMGNKYLQDNAPWKIIKDNAKRCREILTLSANIVKNLSILISPVMPGFALKVQKQLGVGNLTFKDLDFRLSDHKINVARIIYSNQDEIPGFSEKFTADLKVGVIESVKAHPNADKLYVLKVSLGNKSITLVAGLKSAFTEKELIGKKIVVVTNLKHAKIRGVESQGMLLAAEKKGRVAILSAPEAAPGDPVLIEGMHSSEKTITFPDFNALGLSVEGKRVYYGDRVLKTHKGEVVVDAEDGAKIK